MPERFARTCLALMLAIAFGGCAMVSGLDDFEIGAPNTSGEGGAGGAGFATIGGNVTGLLGKGLILKNNGVDDLQIGKDGPFTFPAKLQADSPYDVTVASQPTEPAQACSVTNGSGIAAAPGVTNVQINCATSAYSIGGTVVGLNGAGLVLTNSGADDLPIPSNGPFTFPTEVASGTPFAVAVKTQPASGGPCAVSGGNGVVGTADVNSVLVNCAPGTFTIGGTISGLVGSVVIQQNGGNDLTLTSDGSFAFSQTLMPGSAYAVTVLTQPAYPPRSQNCTITNGTGSVASANVTNVSIDCMTRSFSIGGSVAGNTGPVVLANNGGDNLTVSQAGPFTFSTPVQSGDTYAVSVVTPPPGQSCTISTSTGTIANGDVNNVAVNCSTPMGNPGILCGGSYCDPATMLCCLSGGNYSCVDKCTGGSTIPLACDSAADCGSGVCCGTVSGGNVISTYCTNAANCTAPKAYFCDPTSTNPCPNGGTCTPATSPMGFYRCF